jgi:hypothetical protein
MQNTAIIPRYFSVRDGRAYEIFSFEPSSPICIQEPDINWTTYGIGETFSASLEERTYEVYYSASIG